MIFLHGGGDSPTGREASLSQFLARGTVAGRCHLALVVVEETVDEALESFEAYQAIFAALKKSPDKIAPILLTQNETLIYKQLFEVAPTAVFVCGGTTPLYHQAIGSDLDWLAYLHEHRLPYGGTSAGAAIAAETAVLGGWQVTHNQQTRDILFQGASEGLDSLTVKPALGLVPFAVDVHASQMGTLTRLIHVVDQGLVNEGWAIDENTTLAVDGEQTAVFGLGQAYHVCKVDHTVQLSIHFEGQ